MLFRRTQDAGPQTNLKLVVGLGNIGAAYTNTRHNVGFEVADELAHRAGAHFRRGKFKVEETTLHIGGQRVLVLKPTTLMNLSGEAVVAAARFYKVPSTSVLIICDDMYLPLGRLRLRARGSDGGHNGLWSIIHRLGTDDFPRLRLGVGEPPPGMDMADYVLSRFRPAERTEISEAVSRAASAVETWVKDGIEAAMNRWNAAPPAGDAREPR